MDYRERERDSGYMHTTSDHSPAGVGCCEVVSDVSLSVASDAEMKRKNVRYKNTTKHVPYTRKHIT